MTASLDDLIRARIVEGRFDDVARLVPPPPEAKRTTVELDDSKPQKGLGDLYEAEYLQAVTGVADDKVGGGSGRVRVGGGALASCCKPVQGPTARLRRQRVEPERDSASRAIMSRAAGRGGAAVGAGAVFGAGRQVGRDVAPALHVRRGGAAGAAACRPALLRPTPRRSAPPLAPPHSSPSHAALRPAPQAAPCD